MYFHFSSNASLSNQAYLTILGAVLFMVNAVALWSRWKTSSDVTHMVAELLTTLGVNLGRQLKYKVDPV